MKADGYEPVLKKSRWCRLKRQEHLTDKQTVKLQELLQSNLQSVRAYLLREDFQRFWEYVSPTWAGTFLDDWCRRTMRSRLEPLKKVARTLRTHRGLILNWFVARGEISGSSRYYVRGRSISTDSTSAPAQHSGVMRPHFPNVIVNRELWRRP